MTDNIKNGAIWAGKKVAAAVAIGGIAMVTGFLVKVSKDLVTDSNNDTIKTVKAVVTAINEMREQA